MDEEVTKIHTSDKDESMQPSSTALTIVNADDLNQESLSLINQIIAESDIEKTKLFLLYPL